MNAGWRIINGIDEFSVQHQDDQLCYQQDFQHLFITFISIKPVGYIYQSGIIGFFQEDEDYQRWSCFSSQINGVSSNDGN